MKQIWPDYSYSPATNVLTLTGLNIDRDQLLLVAAPERGRIIYNFADSSVTASAFTSGANTALTLVASTAGLTTTASLVIYYDDQLQSTAVSISNFPATQPVSIASVTVGNTVTIAGTVTANLDPNASVIASQVENGIAGYAADLANDPLPISGTVTIGSALPAGTNRIGVVTIGGGSVTLGASTAQIGSVTASISGTVPVSISSVTIGNSVTIGSLPAISGTVTVGNSVTIGSLPLIAGTVTANVFGKDANSPATAQIPVISYDEGIVGAGSSYVVPVQVTNLGGQISEANPLPISGTVTANVGNISAFIGGGYNNLEEFAGSGGIGVNVVDGTVAVGSLPALVAGTAQIGSVTASISNSVVTFYPMQGTSVSNTNFTSTTASTTLVSAVANREVLTVFNEGAGNLHISPGATCTTISYQVRLSAGDYWECPQGQLSLAHTAVFATAGTARVTQVS